MAVVFDDEELVEALLNRRSGRRLAREELDLDFPSLRRALADKGFVIGIYSPLRYGAAGIVVPGMQMTSTSLPQIAVSTSFRMPYKPVYSLVQ